MHRHTQTLPASRRAGQAGRPNQHLTIVNDGTTALSGWALTATLPGDHIDSVWSANYTVNGNQLTLTPPSDQPTIAPGASQSAFLTASGSTARPTGCEFNSHACHG